ncbi:MAG: DUF2249 domain-containing protein [Magnetococcales bacterium]|nr:DUF2249 domain-containing protein [Magnetococcales bacterium]
MSGASPDDGAIPPTGNILDVSNLPAPEPLRRILERTALLRPGESLTVHHSRVPCLLYTRLAERGLAVTTDPRPDGPVVLVITRPLNTP